MENKWLGIMSCLLMIYLFIHSCLFLESSPTLKTPHIVSTVISYTTT